MESTNDDRINALQKIENLLASSDTKIGVFLIFNEFTNFIEKYGDIEWPIVNRIINYYQMGHFDDLDGTLSCSYVKSAITHLILAYISKNKITIDFLKRIVKDSSHFIKWQSVFTEIKSLPIERFECSFELFELMCSHCHHFITQINDFLDHKLIIPTQTRNLSMQNLRIHKSCGACIMTFMTFGKTLVNSLINQK